jgi:hypothetical protein
MSTFQKEITFLSATTKVVEGKGEIVKEPVSKLASFKELTQDNPDLRGLIFMMRPLYETYKSVDGESKIVANPQILEGLITMCVDKLLILDDKFTIQDKVEFMNDNFAFLAFAEWYLQEKVTPFFLPYLMSWKK